MVEWYNIGRSDGGLVSYCSYSDPALRGLKGKRIQTAISCRATLEEFTDICYHSHPLLAPRKHVRWVRVKENGFGRHRGARLILDDLLYSTMPKRGEAKSVNKKRDRSEDDDDYVSDDDFVADGAREKKFKIKDVHQLRTRTYLSPDWKEISRKYIECSNVYCSR